jgi:hypothetical protein
MNIIQLVSIKKQTQLKILGSLAVGVERLAFPGPVLGDTMVACATSRAGFVGTPGPIPALAHSPLSKKTVYGFFPSSPEISQQSILDLYKALGQHADVVLLQENIPWGDFPKSPDAASQTITDIHNQHILAHQNGLEVIFMADPLNGLNRSQPVNRD